MAYSCKQGSCDDNRTVKIYHTHQYQKSRVTASSDVMEHVLGENFKLCDRSKAILTFGGTVKRFDEASEQSSYYQKKLIFLDTEVVIPLWAKIIYHIISVGNQIIFIGTYNASSYALAEWSNNANKYRIRQCIHIKQITLSF